MGNTTYKLISILILCMGMMLGLQAQKDLLTEPATVEARVIAELDAFQRSESWLKWVEKNEVKGFFSYEITVWNKGEVVSVRPLERSEGAEIKHQNAIKDILKEMKFDFKVPKGNRYLVSYQFIIQ